MYFLRTCLAHFCIFRYNVSKFRLRKEVSPMRSLEESRAAIDAVDREIVRLFEQRMLIARDVAAYKIEKGLPVLDRSREEAVLDSRAGMTADPYWAQSVRALYEQIMALSRAEQEKLLKAAGKEQV